MLLKCYIFYGYPDTTSFSCCQGAGLFSEMWHALHIPVPGQLNKHPQNNEGWGLGPTLQKVALLQSQYPPGNGLPYPTTSPGKIIDSKLPLKMGYVIVPRRLQHLFETSTKRGLKISNLSCCSSCFICLLFKQRCHDLSFATVVKPFRSKPQTSNLPF